MVTPALVATQNNRMKTLRRFVYRETFSAVLFVTLGFLALFFFFDMVDELRWVGMSGGTYQLSHALLTVALAIPSHLYELLPITVLIGTIFVMSRLAQSSEFTIMRTSGLGPGRALGMLMALGALFVAITFVVGDYLAPLSDRAAQQVKARSLGKITTGSTGAWLKERRDGHAYAINVRAIGADSTLQNVRIFEFGADGRLVSQTQAQQAQVSAPDHWTLTGVRRSVLHGSTAGSEASVENLQLPTLEWPTRISTDMVVAAVLKPDRMATLDLFHYIRHLEANGQSAQRYEIEFWRKVFYPLSCLVMVVLALPFAYLHFRSGSVTGYVFGGVMAGISFFLLNNVFGYAGNLQHWSPWLTAAAPGFIYSLLSLAAFGWLVLRR